MNRCTRCGKETQNSEGGYLYKCFDRAIVLCVECETAVKGAMHASVREGQQAIKCERCGEPGAEECFVYVKTLAEHHKRIFGPEDAPLYCPGCLQDLQDMIVDWEASGESANLPDEPTAVQIFPPGGSRGQICPDQQIGAAVTPQGLGG